jgi:hypothetical protein
MGLPPGVAGAHIRCGYLVLTQRERKKLIHIFANDHVAIHQDDPLYSVNGVS